MGQISSHSSGAKVRSRSCCERKRTKVLEGHQCEVYDETTNGWQFITSFRYGPGRFEALLAVDGDLYTSSIIVDSCQSEKFSVRFVCYKPEENKWDTKTEVTARRATFGLFPPNNVCSMRICKGFCNIRPVNETFPSDGSLPGAGTTQPSLASKKPERKCFIM